MGMMTRVSCDPAWPLVLRGVMLGGERVLEMVRRFICSVFERDRGVRPSEPFESDSDRFDRRSDDAAASERADSSDAVVSDRSGGDVGVVGVVAAA